MKNLVLILITIFCFASCNKEDINLMGASWVGTWYVKQVLLDGTLQKPINTSSLSQREFIEITIPEGDTGIIGGATFKNGISFEFKLSADNMVEFACCGGSRAGEDEYGFAFKEQINQTSYYSIENDTMYFNDINDDIIILFTKP